MKIAKGIAGFTLIEVMAASVMIGVIAFSTGQIIQDYTKSTQLVKGSIHLENTLTGVEILLRDEKNCIANVDVNSNPPSLKHSDKIVYLDSSGSEKDFISKAQNSTINKRMGFELVNLAIAPKTTEGYELVMKFKRLKGALAGQSISKRVTLQLEFDAGGSFRKCYSDVSKSTRTVINATVQQACEAAGFIYNLPLDDLDSPSCSADPAQLTDLECDPGEYLQRVDIQMVSGSIKFVKTCKKLLDCPAGQVGLIADEQISCSNLCSAPNQIGIYQNGGYRCIDLDCNQTLGNISYLAGIDSTGKICRKLVDATAVCPTGRPQLTTTPQGALKVVCN